MRDFCFTMGGTSTKKEWKWRLTQQRQYISPTFAIIARKKNSFVITTFCDNFRSDNLTIISYHQNQEYSYLNYRIVLCQKYNNRFAHYFPKYNRQDNYWTLSSFSCMYCMYCTVCTVLYVLYCKSVY